MNARLGMVVAAGLAGAFLLCIVGVVVLAVYDRSIPNVLEYALATSGGALAALLARVGGTDDVRVTNPPNAPIPVQEKP